MGANKEKMKTKKHLEFFHTRIGNAINKISKRTITPYWIENCFGCVIAQNRTKKHRP
jgi:hypothetical protein